MPIVSSRNRAAWLAAAGLVWNLTFAGAAGAAPRIDSKPEVPVQVRLVVVSAQPGQPVKFEARVQAFRPMDDVQIELTLPDGARWARPAGTLSGKLKEGERRTLALSAVLPRAGHSEVHARLTCRKANGAVVHTAAYLAFEDGLPAAPARPARSTQWNGSRVDEYPAQGVK